ncbi:MAG: segregation/condensation protein A [Parachlamydiaceae bacterium]|nr:segregation/condensation protein A [Parachlamydiaceae bacterium]
MKVDKEITVVLENFEGPLDLLFHLIYKCEIDVYEVMLKRITDEFLTIVKEHATPIDKSAEFISTAASLIWFKSRQLLPKHETIKPFEELLEDPHFEIIHHLVDYCRFKHAAKELAVREIEQSVYHHRGAEKVGEAKRNLGIEHLTLEDLAGLFQQIAAKAKKENGQLHEETWKVSDKINYLRKMLTLQTKVTFFELFDAEFSRLELIVIFLAVLELMKLGEISVARELASNEIIIHPLHNRDRDR